MLVIRKRWFWIVCIFLMWHQTDSASVNGLSELETIQEDEAMEYEAEDTAKEQLNSDKGYRWISLNAVPFKANTPDLGKGVRLCTNKEGKYWACKKRRDNLPLCYGEKSGEIMACSKLGEEDPPIPVCKEKASYKIITCVTSTKAFLCFPETGEAKKFRPCSSEHHQACLGKGGALEKCFPKYMHAQEKELNVLDGAPAMNLDGTKTDMLFEPFVSNPEWRNFWKEYVYGFETNAQWPKPEDLLCILSDNKFMECQNTSNSTACVIVAYGTINVCKEHGTSELSVNICLESETNKLMTCGNVTNAHLCWIKDDNLSIARPCRNETRHICLSEGLLSKCSNETKNDTEIYLSDQSFLYANAAVEAYFKSHNDGLHEKLCNPTGTLNSVVKCKKGADFHACIALQKRELGSCSVGEPGVLNVPICRNKNTNELLTCGAFSYGNVCNAPTKNNKFVPCKNPKRFVCIHDWKVEDCSSKRSVAYILDDDEVEAMEKDAYADYQNSERVYRAEDRWIKKIMEGNKHLCSKDGLIKECEPDQAESFFCLDALSGNLSKCWDFTVTELLIPLCVTQANSSIVTCGKFSTAPLCHIDPTTAERCKASNTAQLCLSDDKVEPCKANDQEHVGDYDSISSERGYDDYDEIVERDDYDEESNEIEPAGRRKRGSRTFSDDGEDGDEKSETGYNENKKFGKIDDIHMMSTHLCKPSPDNDKLVNCDEDKKVNFACVGAESGMVKDCRDFIETEIALPICIQVNSIHVVTCDVISNVYLCTGEIRGISTCYDYADSVCLKEDGLIKRCQEPKATPIPKWAINPNNEKFYYLKCTNCSIQNKMVIDGEPDDVVAVTELFTFPTV